MLRGVGEGSQENSLPDLGNSKDNLGLSSRRKGLPGERSAWRRWEGTRWVQGTERSSPWFGLTVPCGRLPEEKLCQAGRTDRHALT